MRIQGELQPLFDALFTIGAIDPVLKMDWSTLAEEMERSPEAFRQAVESLNSCHGQKDELVRTLEQLDQKIVQFVALEVARELAEFSDHRTLH